MMFLFGKKRESFDQAVSSLVSVLASGQENATVQNHCTRVLRTLSSASNEAVAEAMVSVSSFFIKTPIENAISAVMLCGCMVEANHKAQPFIGELENATVRFWEEALPLMESIQKAMEHAEAQGEDRYDAADTVKSQIIEKEPGQVDALDWLNGIYPCLVASYSSDQTLLEHGKQLLQKRVAQFTEVSEACYWLHQLFQVLFNEPVLIVDLENRKGFTGVMSGVVDNFQLQLLLMSMPELGDPINTRHAAIVQGEGPQSSSDSVYGKWDMCNWQMWADAYHPAGEKKSSYWIWSEGKPGDIGKIDDFRIILLNKPSYKRGLPIGRVFKMLPASIKIEKWFTEQELNHWLTKISNAK
ncbi:MAG: hypothetical protein ACTHLE_14010 [Agriterribacter sp.]